MATRRRYGRAFQSRHIGGARVLGFHPPRAIQNARLHALKISVIERLLLSLPVHFNGPQDDRSGVLGIGRACQAEK